ncbi:MAG TPA: 4Fe-4S dicluster domain-containing protein [Gemmobacter sp.]|nr:4Fe-4S dicluster domain-containing protein [Gemmobacter sp.]
MTAPQQLSRRAFLTGRPQAPRIAMTGRCLLVAGISCRLCTDACPTTALRFDPTARPVGAIRIDASACTSCGDCLPPCPTRALTLTPEAR